MAIRNRFSSRNPGLAFFINVPDHKEIEVTDLNGKYQICYRGDEGLFLAAQRRSALCQLTITVSSVFVRPSVGVIMRRRSPLGRTS